LWTSAAPFTAISDAHPDGQLKVIRNRTSIDPQALILLNEAKNVFSRQLPQMGSDYIARLVFDYHAETVLLLHDGVVNVAICSRVFAEERFIEIVFLAVDSELQGIGYGRLIMNYLKTVIQVSLLHDLLTYADNDAIGFFRKLGFNDKAINMNPQRWIKRIKDYERVTLMHCRIWPEIDYMNLDLFLGRTIEFVQRKVGCRVVQPLFPPDDSWIPFPGAPRFQNRPLAEILVAIERGKRAEEAALVEGYRDRRR
jgi:histone acetyltransferase